MASLSLNANSNALSTDIQRLSTGLQINSASDNPAGLVASEDMQAQLSGLSQATSNSNDAINEIKTAEGALNQVQNLLVSMQQLAVGASNLGANDATEVAADQAQIASAIQSINQIAATTQYGQKMLLNGNASSGLTTTSGSSALVAGAAAGSSIASQGTWTAGSAGTYASVFTAATAGAYTASGATIGTVAATDTFSGSVGINGQIYSVASGSNLTALNASIAQSGYTASVTGAALVLTSNATGANAAPTIDASNLQDVTLNTAAAGTGNFNNSGAFVAGTNASMQLTGNQGTPVVLTSTATTTQGNTDYFTFANGLVLTTASNTANAGVPLSVTAVAGATTQGNDLEYQIGANQGQTTSFGIQSTQASQLGQGALDSNGNAVATQNVAAINVTTFQGAQDAINVLNTAINQVSTLRANMGAFENNVLQSNVNSLGVAQTNLQASESTITDTNMATQVVDYTKNSILVQSATQALSFANTMPQYVLKLIQNA
jgi:flagellin